MASNIQGQNINIATGLNQPEGTQDSKLLIQGSHLNATDNLNIQTDILDIQASRDTSRSSTTTQTSSLSVQQTIYGATAGGPSMTGSYDRSQSEDKTSTYNNSTLTANTMNIVTTGDATIQGGNLHADNHLNLTVGGDLLLESRQNRASGSNKGFGVSAGFSLEAAGQETFTNDKLAEGAKNHTVVDTDAVHWGSLGNTDGKVSGANAGLNVSNGRYSNKETVLSSITSGNSMTIDVEGNSHLVGSLIATQDEEGNDLGNLTFSTGTLSHTNLNNTSYSSNQSLSLNTNVGFTEEKDKDTGKDSSGISVNSSSVSISNDTSFSKDKTLATIGLGDVTIGGETISDEHGINRDSSTITREFYDGGYSQSVDASIDHNLFTADGHERIAQDWKDAKKFGEILMGALEVITSSDDLDGTDYIEGIRNFSMSSEVTDSLTGENSHILENIASGDEIKIAQGYQELGFILQAQFGFTPAEVQLYSAKLTTAVGLQDTASHDVHGGVVQNSDAQNMFVDVSGDEFGTVLKTQIGNTIGHETLEVQTIRRNGDNDAAQEALADALGAYFAQGLNEAAGGNLDATGGDFARALLTSQIVQDGTAIANTVGDAEVDNRRLHTYEANLIQITAQAFAKKKDISYEAALERLTQRALWQVDSELGGSENTDQEAGQWLQHMVAAFLKDDKGEFSVELFNATEAQRNDHDLFIEHDEQVTGILNQAAPETETWATQFLTRENPSVLGLTRYSEDEANYRSLQAVVRAELADDIFAGAGYGSNDAIFGWTNAYGVLKPMEEASFFNKADSFVKNPNALSLLGRGQLSSDSDMAMIEYFGLKPSFMGLDSDETFLRAPGHGDVFRDAVSYLTGGSSTPMLAINTGNGSTVDFNLAIDNQLGNYTDSSTAAQIDMHVYGSMQSGDSLDLSGVLAENTVITMMNNKNFLSDYVSFLDQNTTDTSILDSWGDAATHVSFIPASMLESTGKSFEIAFTDDNAPQYMKDDAWGEVVMTVAEVATILKALRVKSVASVPVPNKIDNISTTELESVLGQRYSGVREASQFLKDAGVPREFRKQVLESFDIKTLNVRQATDSEFGIRYFDNVNAWEKGRYLFETFPASRQNLALKPEWNQMTFMKQFQIRPKTTILEGRASSMGVGVEGSQIQKYILDLNDLLEP